MQTKILLVKVTFKPRYIDPDYPADVKTFYGNDAKDKAIREAEKHVGEIVTIETIEGVY